MEAKLGKASVFKKIVEAINEVVDEAEFVVTSTAIKLQAMDKSHVALVAFHLPSDMFDKFHCDLDITLGLNLDIVAKSVKCATDNDTITMRFKKDNPDAISLIYEVFNESKIEESTLRLLNLPHDTVDIPADLKYDVVLDMPSNEFAKTCRHIWQFSESVSIAASKSGVVFSGEGPPGKHTVKYRNNSDKNANVSVFVTVETPVISTFSLSYMLQFAKAAGISDRIRLSLSEGVPVVVEFKIDDNGYLRYYLAPKIDEDADMS